MLCALCVLLVPETTFCEPPRVVIWFDGCSKMRVPTTLCKLVSVRWSQSVVTSRIWEIAHTVALGSCAINLNATWRFIQRKNTYFRKMISSLLWVAEKHGPAPSPTVLHPSNHINTRGCAHNVVSGTRSTHNTHSTLFRAVKNWPYCRGSFWPIRKLLTICVQTECVWLGMCISCFLTVGISKCYRSVLDLSNKIVLRTCWTPILSRMHVGIEVLTFVV